jgi:hypothetical protein
VPDGLALNSGHAEPVIAGAFIWPIGFIQCAALGTAPGAPAPKM